MGIEWNWVVQKGHRKLSGTKQYGYVIDLFSEINVQKLHHIIYNVIMYPCIIDVTKQSRCKSRSPIVEMME